jgi:acetyltransferase-like isoleucine patch superfamily enzyme
MSQTSFSFRVLKKLGLNFSEGEYGKVSPLKVIGKTFKSFRNAFLLKYGLNLVLVSPINARSIRPKIWRIIGCKVGKGVFIGSQVMPDSSNASLIEIEDEVHIAARCILLCHQRDMSLYKKGGSYAKLPYIRKKIVLKKGCLIGTQAMIMPGVTIGEGAVVGAYSLVTKDVPAWTVVTGRPAKIVKEIE